MKKSLITNFKTLLILTCAGFSQQVHAENLIIPTDCAKPKLVDSPFVVSIDDDLMSGQGCNDLKLKKANVQIRFDGLEVSPTLNLNAYPDGAVRGSVVSFTPYTNYSAFIKKAEIRIFDKDVSTQTTPLAVVPAEKNLSKPVYFKIPDVKNDSLQYVLRVYDQKGRFDETEPKSLKLLNKESPVGDEQSLAREQNIGYGENHLRIRNIPIHGGTITVNNANYDEIIAPNSKVFVMNKAISDNVPQEIPVDANGKFAYKQIVPNGDHQVDVMIEDKNGNQTSFSRELNIPNNDLFYVGLADLTVGKNKTTGPAALVTNDNSNRYSNNGFAAGRLAFYLKNKFDDWQLTSSADTQEQPIGDLFSNFASKDPRYLLERLDPNSYYPVYGDDSTAIEDAPTKGKFYTRLENDTTKLVWGNFQTKLTGSELINYSRGLYGAGAEFKGRDITKYGEAKTEANGFAADPGSISSLEEFRGTGGSLYYLRSQDVVVGSERIRIEVRDRDSGIVLQTKYLTYGEDYDINYMQGRLVLRDPLSSTASSELLINNGSNGGNPTYLVTTYEYTPSANEINNFTKGGRVTQWLNDYVQLGATAYNQGGFGTNQDLKGADLTLRYKPQTYLKIEGAKSDGAGTGSLASQDGGFNFSSTTTAEDVAANAYRVETALDLSEITDKYKGKIDGYYVNREQGYSAPGQLTDENVVQSGLKAQFPVNEKLNLNVKADLKKGDLTGEVKTAQIAADYALNKHWTSSLALSDDERHLSAIGFGDSLIMAEEGKRVDVGGKLNYASLSKNYEVYGLAQATLAKDEGRSQNNRIGVGGKYDVNKKVTASGEVTGGDGGLGSKVGLEYRPSDRTSYYSNYEMDTQRSDLGIRGRNSSFTTGGKSRYTDSLSMYAEQKQQSFAGGTSGLMGAFGLDLAATDRWNVGGKFENGVTSDPTSGDIERTAISLNTNYHHEKTKFNNITEWRVENGNAIARRNSYLVKNNLAYQTTPDWRFLGDANFAISDAGVGDALDANYVELSSGYAYRPVENDKVNALVKYTFLSDLGSPGQNSPANNTVSNIQTSSAHDFEQRSHVFNGDVIVDVMPQLSVGGKLGYRFGQIRATTPDNSPWFGSHAYLAILRSDLHVTKKWDATAEARYLNASEAKDAKSGALVGVYRHINQNAKFGIGYNFTDFSDDLTDLDYRSHGFFINMVGKF